MKGNNPINFRARKMKLQKIWISRVKTQDVSDVIPPVDYVSKTTLKSFVTTPSVVDDVWTWQNFANAIASSIDYLLLIATLRLQATAFTDHASRPARFRWQSRFIYGWISENGAIEFVEALVSVIISCCHSSVCLIVYSMTSDGLLDDIGTSAPRRCCLFV